MERLNSAEVNKKLEFLAIEAFKSSGYLIVNKTLIKKLGVFPAILLSNYIDKHIYFKEKFPEADGWFYLTHQQQKEQLNINEHSIIKSKQFLIDKKIIESQKRGIPSKEYLHIDFKVLINELTDTILDPLKTGGLDPVISGGLFKDNKYKDIYTLDSTKSNSSEVENKITASMFEEMWRLYPRKIDKGKAKTAWLKICRKPPKERPSLREVKSAIRRQIKSERWQTTKFIPHPTTWLNQSRWLDDAEEMKQTDFSREQQYTCPNGWTFGESFSASKQGCMECEDYTPKIYAQCKLANKNLSR